MTWRRRFWIICACPPPPRSKAQSQLGALKAGESAEPRAVYSESLYAHDAFRWAPLRALRVGKYKYIQAPKAELYDLDADPREQVNLLHKNAAMAAELQNELAKVLTRYAPSQRATPPALTPETLAQLESLGYLAAEPRAVGAPKRRGTPWRAPTRPQGPFRGVRALPERLHGLHGRAHRRGPSQVSVDSEIRPSEHAGAIPSGRVLSPASRSPRTPCANGPPRSSWTRSMLLPPRPSASTGSRRGTMPRHAAASSRCWP